MLPGFAQPLRWLRVSYGASGELVTLNVSSSPGHRLAGSLSPSVAALRGLRLLTLPSHMLSGTLPAAVGSLLALRRLSLAANRLGGAVLPWRHDSAASAQTQCYHGGTVVLPT